ncbi:flagellar basal body rod protein FlgB [Desulforhabdus sp. TSK]|uniref:flagellar basal body rod protein FlgB n=1 Tax=Desulforhabdus sp. TSK TaxID=2925014 RepID=UPI001FC87A7E|nr:flagellar basal body rod protein FlgB [Desulforhabdus sp. TSK]GKT07392.1 flagellar basal body rod protein FlgB [Desulforhabdus sp. TSK]
MGNSVVFDKTVQLMQDRLNLNSLNQQVISANLANLSTPGYAARELSFDATLRDAMEDNVLHLTCKSPQHRDPVDLEASMKTPELVSTGAVDLDREMVNLSRNNIEYQYMVTMLNKKFTMLKQAISDGGM